MALSKKGLRAARTLGISTAINKELLARKKAEQDAFLRAMEERKMLLEEQKAASTQRYQERSLAETIRSRRATEEADRQKEATATKRFNKTHELQIQKQTDTRTWRETQAKTAKDDLKQRRLDKKENDQKQQFASVLVASKNTPFSKKQIEEMQKRFNLVPYASEVLNLHNQSLETGKTNKVFTDAQKMYNSSIKDGNFRDSSHIPDKHLKLLFEKEVLPVPSMLKVKDLTGIESEKFDINNPKHFQVLRKQTDKAINKSYVLKNAKSFNGEQSKLDLGFTTINIPSAKALASITKKTGKEVYKNRFPYLGILQKVDSALKNASRDEVIANKDTIVRVIDDLIRKSDGLVHQGKDSSGAINTYFINQKMLNKYMPTVMEHITLGNLPKGFLDHIMTTEVAGSSVKNLTSSTVNGGNNDIFIATKVDKRLGGNLNDGKPISPDVAILTFDIEKQTKLTPKTKEKMQILQPLFNNFIDNQTETNLKPLFNKYQELHPNKSIDQVSEILIKAVKQITTPKSFDTTQGHIQGQILIKNPNLEYLSPTDSSKERTRLQNQMTQNADIRNLINETKQFIKRFPLSAGAGATVAMGIEDVKSIVKGVAEAGKDWLNKSFDEMLKPNNFRGANGAELKKNMTQEQAALLNNVEAQAREEYESIDRETKFLAKQNGWSEGKALEFRKIRKVIVLKKMALTYRLSGLFQGDSSGRTISNQDYDVAMGALWGEPYAIEAKMDDLEHYFSLKYKSMETLSNNIDSGIFRQVMTIRRFANRKLSNKYVQKVLNGENFKNDFANQSAQSTSAPISKVIPFYRNVQRFYKGQENVLENKKRNNKIAYNYTMNVIKKLSPMYSQILKEQGTMKVPSILNEWPTNVKEDIQMAAKKLAPNPSLMGSAGFLQNFIIAKDSSQVQEIQKAFFVYIANEIRKNSQKILDADVLKLR
jgi:hypothetical protein